MKLYVEEERKEERIEAIKKLMKKLKMSAKEAMNTLGISPQDQKTYFPMLKKG